MSNTAPAAALSKSKRLDIALRENLVVVGTRFLYSIRGTGKLYEGHYKECSPRGFVNLNNSQCWDRPEEVFVEEILSGPAPVAETNPAVPETPAPLPETFEPKGETNVPPGETNPPVSESLPEPAPEPAPPPPLPVDRSPQTTTHTRTP